MSRPRSCEHRAEPTGARFFDRAFRILLLLPVVACAPSAGASAADAGRTEDSGVVDGAPTSALAVTIASGLGSRVPARLLSDGTTLFWTDFLTGTLSSMPARGGAVTGLATGVTTNVLVMDGTSLYFLADGILYQMPKAGGTKVAIPGSGGVATAAALRGGVVYLAETRHDPTSFAVTSSPVGGGPAQVIAQLSAAIPPEAMTATKDSLFFASGGVALVIPLLGLPEGGAPEADATGSCVRVSSDDDAAYCGAAATLSKIASDGTSSVLASAESAWGVAVDTSYVYWVNDALDGGVMKISKQGGTPTTLAKDVQPTCVAVDDEAVYWGSSGDGTIKRLSK